VPRPDMTEERSETATTKRFRIGVDVGGTFTDVAAHDGTSLIITKTLSTPKAEHLGVMAGIAKVAGLAGLSLDACLRQTDVIVHGTTVATNAMLTHSGAITGLLTTEGFRDELEIRRGTKESMFNVKLPPPPTIVPRHRRLGIPERHGAQGEVVRPLDEAAAREAIRSLRDSGCEAVAVSFLFSFLRPEHENRVAELIREEWPDVYLSLSSDVLPQIRDFERTSTTVVNAYVGPGLERYLLELESALGDAGFDGQLFIMQSNGGMTAAKEAVRRPVYCLFSGPAGGIVAALREASHREVRNLITVDMGGTSYDVCLVSNGQPETTTDAWVGRYRVAVPMLDVHSIGAGGGSIAWIDAGGALQVGPRSAGAMPGPACYGRGGSLPTVTDANLVLGYLDSGRFADGELMLDKRLAELALDEHVAGPLGMSVVDAAYAVFRLVNANMANGIRTVSVQRGFNPADFVLVAFGGAAAIHAGVQADDLRIPTVLVPGAAPVLCAYGDLMADIRVSEVQTFTAVLQDVDPAALDEAMGRLAERARERVPSQAANALNLSASVDLRYRGEVYELTIGVPLDGTRLATGALAVLAEQFHAVHEQRYAYRDLRSPIDLLNLRLEAWVPTPELEQRLPVRDVAPSTERTRLVHLGEAGFVSTPVYRTGEVPTTVAGPAVIEEAWTTILVQPWQTAKLDERGNYVLTRTGDA
jgi:N-methylhydantoinase A